MRNIFKRIKKSKKTQKMINHDDQLKYRLAGLYLKDDINLKPIKDQIQENTNKIDQQENTINDHENKINNNINNISSNINNINNINTKINKITNDLNNANLANYKGLYNKTINYKLGDLVSENNTNNVYLSVQNNNINNPLNNNNFWKIITFTLDTSDYVQKSYLTDNYFNKQDTIQQINLKKHKKSFYNMKVLSMECKSRIIEQDPLNQRYLYSYYLQGNIDLPTQSNVEPNKDYYVLGTIRNISTNKGVIDFKKVVYNRLLSSNSAGNLIIPTHGTGFHFVWNSLLTNDEQNYARWDVTIEILIIRIGD